MGIDPRGLANTVGDYEARLSAMRDENARLRSELDAARADMHAWEDTANDWKAKYDEARRALEQWRDWARHQEWCAECGEGYPCNDGQALKLAAHGISALPPSRGSEGADSGGG